MHANFTNEQLNELKALPLEKKIQQTQARIIEWYNYFDGKVFISYSGGKDSTVLLDIVRKLYPDMPAVFSNTGLEYPEIQTFVKNTPNVTVIRPSMSFPEVIKTYGYPLISKEVSMSIYYSRRIFASRERERESKGLKSALKCRKELMGNRYDTVVSETGERDKVIKSAFNKTKWLPLAQQAPFLIGNYCCFVMKKSPLAKYSNHEHIKPYLATTVDESRMRKQAWLHNGCNEYNALKQTSHPMSFWTEQDILAYIKNYGLEICSVYGEIQSDSNGKLKCSKCQRTGCIYCAYGLYLEKGETRFQALKRTHPKQYEYCIGGGDWIDNPYYVPDASTEPDETGWVNWNPKRIWVPNKQGLGLGKVFDICNEIYGEGFIKYK